MKAFLIAIGDEILSGNTLDTNSNFISGELEKVGISVIRISVISDQNDNIKEELTSAFHSEAKFIFTTGGLGPTKDDKTKYTIAEFFSDVLVYDQASLDNIDKRFKKLGIPVNELTKNQALVPSKSIAIVNQYGTAPIIWTEKEGKVLINLPGVPHETRSMLSEVIIPKIKQEYKLPYIITKLLTVINYPESELAIQLENWENNLPNTMSLSYLPSGGRVKLKLTNKGENRNLVENQLKEELDKLPMLLGDRLASFDSLDIQGAITKFIINNNLKLFLIEDLTQGLISNKVSSSEISNYYLGTYIPCSEYFKENILNIKKDDIQKYGWISEEMAKKIVEQTAKLLEVDIVISTIGITDIIDQKDISLKGLVYVGLYFKGEILVKKYFYPNISRIEIMEIISNKALDTLYLKIKEYTKNRTNIKTT